MIPKPPLGVAPRTVLLLQRNRNLAEAILRYLNEAQPSFDNDRLMLKWSAEMTQNFIEIVREQAQ